jgi:hypothetical protein
MFSFPDVIHLFANELTSLRGRRFARRGILPRSFQRLLFRHVEPPEKFRQVWFRSDRDQRFTPFCFGSGARSELCVTNDEIHRFSCGRGL